MRRQRRVMVPITRRRSATACTMSSSPFHRAVRTSAAGSTSKGVEVTWDDDFPGHRRLYAFDTLGNRLEFLQRDDSLAEW